MNEMSKLRRLSALCHTFAMRNIVTKRKMSRRVGNCNIYCDSFLMHFNVKLCKSRETANSTYRRRAFTNWIARYIPM